MTQGGVVVDGAWKEGGEGDGGGGVDGASERLGCLEADGAGCGDELRRPSKADTTTTLLRVMGELAEVCVVIACCCPSPWSVASKYSGVPPACVILL